MKRPPDRLTLSILVLVLVTVGLVVSPGTNTNASKLASRGPSLTIIFRGLMTFRRDHEEQTLAAAILPAPEHEFTIQVLEKSPHGISTYSIPMNQLVISKRDTLLAEFPAKRNGVSYYQNGVFDRTKDVGDNRDFPLANRP